VVYPLLQYVRISKIRRKGVRGYRDYQHHPQFPLSHSNGDLWMSEVTPTARDLIYAELLEADKIRWRVGEMVESTDGKVSRYTVRNCFNSLADLGVLNHKSGSPYWYFLQ